jgi:hypothetical protein
MQGHLVRAFCHWAVFYNLGLEQPVLPLLQTPLTPIERAKGLFKNKGLRTKVSVLGLHRSQVRTSFVAIGGTGHYISHHALPDVPHQAIRAKMSCRVQLSSSPSLPTFFPQQQPLIPPSSRRVGTRFGVHTDYLIHEWTAAYLSVTGYRNDYRRAGFRTRTSIRPCWLDACPTCISPGVLRAWRGFFQSVPASNRGQRTSCQLSWPLPPGLGRQILIRPVSRV